MTLLSVTPYRSFSDFLSSPQGQEIRQALAEEPAGLVSAVEGRQQVRLATNVAQALEAHAAQSFPDMAAVMASPYGHLLQGLSPDDVAVVRTQAAPRPTLGQALGKTAADAVTVAAAPSRLHRGPRAR